MSRNIRTIADLNGDRTSDHDSSGSDHEESGPPNGRRQQDFYVGSGQQVLGPPGSRPEDVLSRVINAARSNGAEAVSAADLPGRRPQANPRGNGVRLGDTGAAVAPEAAGTGGVEDPIQIGESYVVHVTMNLWTNGFSIDDGPLRSPSDPENQSFLSEIARGRVPAEIERLYRGRHVDFHMERKNTEFVPPKTKPFQGSGVRLGNVVPNIVSTESSSSSSSAPAISEKIDYEKALQEAKAELKLDESLPTTNIQIRLPNNVRVLATVNHAHTVSSLRNYICTARPEMVYQPFQLANSYPPKVLDDETQTVADANILNAAIVVRPQS